MKYLSVYKIFEADDADTMARYQLFEADSSIAFAFSSGMTTDPDEIKMFIKKYNETYISEGEWGGGPPNKKFINFWNNYNWDNELTHHYKKKDATANDWKPVIQLIINTPNYGYYIIGYSIRTKKAVLTNWSNIKTNPATKYDHSVMSEIQEYVQKNIYKYNITLDETIELLQLSVSNMVDWEWEGDTT